MRRASVSVLHMCCGATMLRSCCTWAVFLLLFALRTWPACHLPGAACPASHCWQQAPPPSPSLLPTDLNGYLLQMEENIADFAAELGCPMLEQRYRQLATDRCGCRLRVALCWAATFCGLERRYRDTCPWAP